MEIFGNSLNSSYTFIRILNGEFLCVWVDIVMQKRKKLIGFLKDTLWKNFRTKIGSFSFAYLRLRYAIKAKIRWFVAQGLICFQNWLTLLKLQQSWWNYIVFLNVLQEKSLHFTCILISIENITSFPQRSYGSNSLIGVRKVVSTTDYRSFLYDIICRNILSPFQLRH